MKKIILQHSKHIFKSFWGTFRSRQYPCLGAYFQTSLKIWLQCCKWEKTWFNTETGCFEKNICPSTICISKYCTYFALRQCFRKEYFSWLCLVLIHRNLPATSFVCHYWWGKMVCLLHMFSLKIITNKRSLIIAEDLHLIELFALGEGGSQATGFSFSNTDIEGHELISSTFCQV